VYWEKKRVWIFIKQKMGLNQGNLNLDSFLKQVDHKERKEERREYLLLRYNLGRLGCEKL
jgi:hypothetical protein